jgi:hypothetical protein
MRCSYFIDFESVEMYLKWQPLSLSPRGLELAYYGWGMAEKEFQLEDSTEEIDL